MADRMWLYLGRAATGGTAHLVGGAVDLVGAVFAYRRIRRLR